MCGFPSLDNEGGGPLDRGNIDVVVDQASHPSVARISSAAAEYDCHDITIGAANRRDDVESGVANITRLDAVDAVNGAKQMIVVSDRFAAVIERPRREIVIVIRKAILNGTAENSLIARGCDLLGLGQA